jgi:hypothetical protein
MPTSEMVGVSESISMPISFTAQAGIVFREAPVSTLKSQCTRSSSATSRLISCPARW